MSTLTFGLRDTVSLGDGRAWIIVKCNRLTGVYTLECGPDTRNVYAEQMTLVRAAE
jgi:hypothetical protein